MSILWNRSLNYITNELLHVIHKYMYNCKYQCLKSDTYFRILQSEYASTILINAKYNVTKYLTHSFEFIFNVTCKSYVNTAVFSNLTTSISLHYSLDQRMFNRNIKLKTNIAVH